MKKVSYLHLGYVFHLIMWPQSCSKNIFLMKNSLFWEFLDLFQIFITILRAFCIPMAHNMYTFSETMRQRLSIGLKYAPLSEDMRTQEFFHTFWQLNVTNTLKCVLTCSLKRKCSIENREFKQQNVKQQREGIARIRHTHH